MPRYSIPVTAIYLDTLTIEADSREEALELALNEQHPAECWTHDPDPLLSATLEEVTALSD